ncbi:hypothetical protein [Actinoallomurus liliacearum]|uniref:hypothetical protein n=1 Tax=Actinoallomurus liliacearum TaxID=1080073 RepID=UPI0031F08AF1
MNEVIHDISAGAAAVRIFTLVEPVSGTSFVQVWTRQTELLVEDAGSVERYRTLFDEITGSTLSSNSTSVAVREPNTGDVW